MPASPGPKTAQNAPPRSRTRRVSRPSISLAAGAEAVGPRRSMPAPKVTAFVFVFLPLLSQKAVFLAPPTALGTLKSRHFDTSSRQVYARAASPVSCGSALTRCVAPPSHRGTRMGLRVPSPTALALKKSSRGPIRLDLFSHVRGRRSKWRKQSVSRPSISLAAGAHAVRPLQGIGAPKVTALVSAISPSGSWETDFSARPVRVHVDAEHAAIFWRWRTPRAISLRAALAYPRPATAARAVWVCPTPRHGLRGAARRGVAAPPRRRALALRRGRWTPADHRPRN